MLNHSSHNTITNVPRWFFVLCILIPFLPILRGGLILGDPFHHGEYFHAAAHFFNQEAIGFIPLTIHGAIDFVPTVMARGLWGGWNYFLPTAALHQLLGLFASMTFIALSYELTREKESQRWSLVVAALVAPLCVADKDLFLLLSLYLFILIGNRSWPRRLEIILKALFGLLVAIGFFWSFDRGIAQTVSLGIATLFLARKNRDSFVSIFVFLLVIGLLGIYFPVFSLSNYVENVHVLMETSLQWSYGFQSRPVRLTIFAFFVNAYAFFLYVRSYFQSGQIKSKISEVIVFFLLSAFMLKIGTNRADLGHIYMSLWMPMLMLNTVRVNPELGRYWKYGVVTVFLAALYWTLKTDSYGLVLVGAGLACIVFATPGTSSRMAFRTIFYLLVSASLSSVIYSGAKGLWGGQYNWIARMHSPPSNSLSSTKGVAWASEQILRAHAKCVFDLSNNGVINGLTNLSGCSRFSYLVYAGKQHEDELISALRLTMPSVIVYSSTYWSYSIDGRTMRDRFPVLDAFILARYPKEECAHGYCMRYSGDA